MATTYYRQSTDGRADWWQNIINNSAALTAFNATAAPDILNDAKTAVYLYRTLPQLYRAFNEKVHAYITAYLGHADGTPAPTPPTLPAWPALPVMGILAGIEKRREQWVQMLKHSPGYDPATIGMTLRLEGVQQTLAPDTQAVIRSLLSNAPSTVIARFGKANGMIDGMQFNGRKSGTSPFTNLGRFTATPATLTIPVGTPGQPEEWEIQGQALKRDQLIGTPSDIISVIVQG